MNGNMTTSAEPAASVSAPLRRKAFFPEIPADLLWRAAPFLIVIWMTSLSTLPALDFWWHLKAGEIVVATRSIPTRDLFSFTAAGQPYFLQNWLAGVIFYLVYSAGGPPLVIFLHTLVLLAAALPLYLLAIRRASGIQNAIAATCLAVIPLVFHSQIRPQVFSFLLFAWFWFILLEFRSHRTQLLWFLPLLMVAWVNLDGAFVLGIALIVLFLALDLVARFFGEPECYTGSERRSLVSVLVVTCAATLLNPQSIGVYDSVVKAIWHPAALERVTEWQSPEIRQSSDVVRFFGPFFLGSFILIRSKIRSGVRDIGMFLTFALLALSARTNGAWFAMVAGPLVASHLKIGRHREPAVFPSSFHRHISLLVAAFLIVCTALSLPWIQQLITGRSPERLFLDAKLPVRAADFVAAKRLEGRMFHPESYGDYLIWRLWPRQHTFIDSRALIFSRDVTRDYFEILSGAVDWEIRVHKYQIQYLLLDRTSTDQKKLVGAARKAPQWQVLYEDERSVLFSRAAKPVESLQQPSKLEP